MIIEKVKYEDAGLYRCVAKNKFGEATSQSQVRVTGKLHKISLANIFLDYECEPNYYKTFFRS